MSLKEQFADQLKSQTDIWQAQIKDYQETSKELLRPEVRERSRLA